MRTPWPSAAPSGHGEGKYYLGSTTVTTDGSGDVAFNNVSLTTLATVGDVIRVVTATATDADGNTSEFSAAVVASQNVTIDIKPVSDLDAANLASQGLIAVSILTTAAFDAALVDVSTVHFAGAQAVHSALVDVDGDGDLDMVLHFRTQDTNLRALYEQLIADDLDCDGILDSNHQVAEVSLTGATVEDVLFAGLDQLDLFLSGRTLRELLEEMAAAGAI